MLSEISQSEKNKHYMASVIHLSCLSSLPSPELNLLWWQHHEEGEAIPALEEFMNSPGEGRVHESKLRASKI